MTRLVPAAVGARRRARRALAALLAVTGLLVLAGCMKIDMSMTLTEDDTVSGSVVMAVSDEVAESLGMDAGELGDRAGGELSADLPDGTTQEPYSDGEYTGSTFTFADTPISELSGAGTDDLSVTREGDEYVVTGVMDLSEGAEGMEGATQMPREILDTFLVTISVTFPGEVVETNGTVDGTTVTWNPAFGETTEMSARGSAVADGSSGADAGAGTDDGAGAGTEPGSTASQGAATGDGAAVTDAEETSATDDAGFPWWIVGLVVGLAVLGLVAALVVRHNRRPEPAPGRQDDAFGALPGQQGTGYAPPAAPGQTPPGPPSQPPGQPPVDPYDPHR